MKKKWMKVMAMACALMLCMTGFAFAANDADYANNPEEITPASSGGDMVSKTITDKHGNKYKVMGYSAILAKKASSYTAFDTTYYYGGKKAPVDAYTKTLTGTGTVTFSGSATGNSYTKTAKMTGASGNFTPSDTYDFYVKTVNSVHEISCQGGSGSTYSYIML